MPTIRKGIHSYGPGIVVLGAAAVAMLVGPLAVRSIVHAQTSVDVVQASARLAQPGNVLEEINAAQRLIASAVEPSVVHVSTIGNVRRRSMNQAFVSSGSGWVYDDAGHIVTNAHVVDGADRVQVQFYDGTMRDATIVGVDLRTDIAVVKVAEGGLVAAKRGNSDDVQQGDMVFAFGSPFDFRFSMSSGIVSGLGRSAGLAEIDYQNFIQTDAAINPGNSGGPLTDIYGRVVGMNTAIATGRGNTVGQGQFAGIGLAIPMSMIESVVSQLIDSGEVRKGYLGIQIESPDSPALARTNNPAFAAIVDRFEGEGAVVAGVERGSPAQRAGLRPGDVIVRVDGRRLSNAAQVRAIISSRRPGSAVNLDVWRMVDGEPQVVPVQVTLGELDPMRSEPVFALTLERLGLSRLSTATEERTRELGVPFRRGVLVEGVRPDSPIAAAMPVGSIIIEVLGQPVSTDDELYARVSRFLRGMRVLDPNAAIPISFVTPAGDVRRDAIPLFLDIRR
jgi:serine protease Do